MRKFTIEITRTGEEQPVRTAVEVQDDDWNLLQRFVAHTGRLGQTRVVREDLLSKVELILGFSPGQIAIRTDAMPDQEVVSDFLMAMRPFILENEATHFGKVRNKASQVVPNGAFREWLKLLKARFGCARFGDLKVDDPRTGESLSKDDVLWSYVYGFEYHLDESRRRALAPLESVFSLEETRYLALAMLREKSKAVLQLADALASLGGDSGSADLP